MHPKNDRLFCPCLFHAQTSLSTSRRRSLRLRVLLRARSLPQPKPGLFRLVGLQLLPAQRTGLKGAGPYPVHQNGDAPALHRDLRMDNPTTIAIGRLRTEEPFPLEEPLVEFPHAASLFSVADIAMVVGKRPVTASDRF